MSLSLTQKESSEFTIFDNTEILQSPWNLYFHDPFNYNWDKKSFYNIYTINTISDFWDIFNSLKHFLNVGMFFFMRNNIIPLWEEPENKNGGYISYKLSNNNFINEIEKILIMVLSENTLKNEYINDFDIINGISISPKKNFSIIRIWLKSMKYNDIKYYNADPKTTFIKENVMNY